MLSSFSSFGVLRASVFVFDTTVLSETHMRMENMLEERVNIIACLIPVQC